MTWSAIPWRQQAVLLHPFERPELLFFCQMTWIRRVTLSFNINKFNWCRPFLAHKGLVYLPSWVITKNTWLNHGIHHFSLEIKKKRNNEVNFKSIAKYVTFFFLKYTDVLQTSNWRELGSPVLKRPAGVVPLMTDHHSLGCQTLTRKYPNSLAP